MEGGSLKEAGNSMTATFSRRIPRLRLSFPRGDSSMRRLQRRMEPMWRYLYSAVLQVKMRTVTIRKVITSSQKKKKSLLAQISASYDSVVLVINTGGLIDLAFTEEFTNIKSIVQFMQAGQEGGSAFADIVSGAVNPSGKMTDSWAYTYLDYPNARTFSHKNGNTDTEKYEEGIFVGYRYFDTFDVPVRYGFGFGLSYTEFSVVGTGVSASGLGTDQPKISVTASVKNTGNTYAGKEVAEVYVSCPQNGMPKEYRRLAGFAKTRLLSPGENQDLTITFPLYQLASYHEDRSAWILEAGTYGIWVGNSLESASLSATISLDADVVMVQCESICERKEDLKELIPDAGKMKEKEAAWKSLAESLKLPDLSVCADQIVTETVAYPEHSGVTEGKVGEIVSTLSEEQLIALATGDPGKGQENALGSAGLTVPGAAAETSSSAIESPWNVASMVLADGPAGLRLHKTYQVVDGKINKGSSFRRLKADFSLIRKSRKEPLTISTVRHFRSARFLPRHGMSIS